MTDDKKLTMSAEAMDEWMGTQEVPGRPGFAWHSKIGEADPKLEQEYRAGYFAAIQHLMTAIQRGGKYDRGYQHALTEIARAHNRRGRLDAADLREWVNDTGRRWLSDLPMDKQVLPPEIKTTWDRLVAKLDAEKRDKS